MVLLWWSHFISFQVMGVCLSIKARTQTVIVASSWVWLAYICLRCSRGNSWTYQKKLGGAVGRDQYIKFFKDSDMEMWKQLWYTVFSQIIIFLYWPLPDRENLKNKIQHLLSEFSALPSTTETFLTYKSENKDSSPGTQQSRSLKNVLKHHCSLLLLFRAADTF